MCERFCEQSVGSPPSSETTAICVTSRECSYSIRLYSLHELGKLLHDVGFRVTEASGHPSMPGVFFGEQSPRLIVLAQKP